MSDSFEFKQGRILNQKYEIISLLGNGWEGEVYLVREIITGIERAIKFFYPKRNLRNKTIISQAKKLHKLRHCAIVMNYHSQEIITFRKQKINCLVSEYIQGELLTQFLERQPGKRISGFQGIHLLHELAAGVEEIHQINEYHGDLHSDNIIIEQFGLGYKIKLIDVFHWNLPKKNVIKEELFELIRIFYDCLGGQKYYKKFNSELKSICMGLKKSLITKKFKSVSQLKTYLETLQWSS